MSEVPQEAKDWLRSRPDSIKALMRKYPPDCRVKARPGVVLMAPAPGVEGNVQAYCENGNLRVAAPLAKDVTSPATGATLAAGEMVGGECRPEQLEIVGWGKMPEGVEITPTLIASILDE